MRTWHVVLIAALSLTACGKRKLHWSDKRATTLEVGGVSAPIPAGWRDASEATDEDMKKLLAQQKGGKAIVKENFDGASVLVNVGPIQDFGPKPPCEQLAQQLGTADKFKPENITLIQVAGDPTCRFTTTQDKISVTYQMRFHGTTAYFVICSDTEQGKVGAVCDQITSSLK